MKWYQTSGKTFSEDSCSDPDHVDEETSSSDGTRESDAELTLSDADVEILRQEADD